MVSRAEPVHSHVEPRSACGHPVPHRRWRVPATATSGRPLNSWNRSTAGFGSTPGMHTDPSLIRCGGSTRQGQCGSGSDQRSDQSTT
eukprot:355487-Chlamydomonas_euryale.AAC.6